MPRLGDITDIWQNPAIADQQSNEKCNAFWTMMNGGVCSDSMGRYLRRDGTPVTFEEQVGSKSQGVDLGQILLIGGIAIGGLVVVKLLKG